VNLGVGAYRDDNSKPYVFNVVKRAEQEIANETNSGKLDKEYLPIEGLAEFNTLTQHLLFGKENPLLKEGRVILNKKCFLFLDIS
jgi:aspartate aminotransferase, cytoplasmic